MEKYMDHMEKYLKSIDKSLQNIADSLKKMEKRYKDSLPSIAEIDRQLLEQYQTCTFVEPKKNT